jgi:hypothetical protein
MSERPQYETTDDIVRETEVAKHLADKWSLSAIKLRKGYKCDWAFLRNTKVTALVEIKCRTNASDKYPTVILSADKWAYLVHIDAALNIPAYFIVRFTDSIRHIRPAKYHNFNIRMGGRYDRGDWQDMEPVVHIPIESMTCCDLIK